MMKPKALVLPRESMLKQVCSEECKQLIESAFNPVWNDKGCDLTEEELSELVEDAEIILTSWGSPILTDAMLEKAVKLRAIGHAAGTVKKRMPREVFDKGVRVYSAANRIAQSVGEHCLAVLLTIMKRLPAFNAEIRQHNWKATGQKGRELAGSTVGIVSASSTARAFLKLLAPFKVNVLLYDPYLSEEAADKLHVRRASLEEVMSCPVISIHAPALPATEQMITRDLIALIPDGAYLVNSSRGAVFDEEALIEELGTGRFAAALDVFVKEPIRQDHPFLQMSNVLLTPHIAGASIEGHLALMYAVVQDMLAGFAGQPTSYEVTERMWETMA
ncbi:hydroxyacid dehydrogenase [Paenibacillus thalictri]|uniref:Hydroxyacid dehydrogenase n=1 Tax=Paenibacillus thalictri TaxID=2527873 RepID=A0A4Q9DQY4_9BACL|nr:hydroxyacid dehydrogenase [Paenibacillus thalictri]TBL77812.1 hydroxyacid dehydrogenase [Paenibacillus thalictri]